MNLTLADIWPPFGLSVTCGALTLSAMRDTDLPELATVAAAGIHDADSRPFPHDWASSTAPVEVGRSLASRYWKYRAMSTNEWALPLVARVDGRIVGVQGAEASHYPTLRTPDTFSWLTRSAQGQGLGTLMRQAICTLLFDELDAHQITSGAYADNAASAAVSRKVGYSWNGSKRELRDERAADHDKFILSRAAFVRPEGPVRITGAAEMRDYLGVARTRNES